MKRGNKIIYIGDGKTSLFKIKDFYVFEDSWITEHDKTLLDDNSIEYNVLEYAETRDYVCDRLSSILDIGYPCSSWKWVNRSCVKLDKEVKIGQILFVKK